MKRSIDFSEVTNYDLELSHNGLVLKIHQGDVVTDIHVQQLLVPKTPKPVQPVPTLKVVQASKKKSQHRGRRHYSNWKPGEIKLDKQKVMEIRQLWPEVLAESGTKTKACKTLGGLYGCSSANVGLIIDRKTWVHV